MSESVEVTQASSPPQARKGFAARVMGVFLSPGETFEDIARRPTILAPLLLLFVVQATVTYLVTPAQGQDAALFTENSSLLQRLSEEQRAQIIEDQRNPSSTTRMVTAVAAPVVILVFMLIFALLYWGVGNLLGGQPTFKKVLSMLLFASMIGLVAGSLIKLPLVLSKNTLAGVTFGPAMFMPDLAITSARYRLFAIFDLFALWGVVVTGIGFAKVAKISTAAAMTTSIIFFAIISALGYVIAGLFS